MKILVRTNPFGEKNQEPREVLENISGVEVIYNNLGRKYTKEELMILLKEHNPIGIIAGTENYNAEILDLCPNLKILSRVGIGLDSVDLEECKRRNIEVANTPDAPANAVAEITIGQIINMLREIRIVENNLKNRQWSRYIGREIKTSKIGIIGCGRIGTLVFNKLQGFNPKQIMINDSKRERVDRLCQDNYASKEEILRECDIITIHIPLNDENHDYITARELLQMKKDAIILNFSRGGIINEYDLYLWLRQNSEAKGAVDTYEEEPYTGNLIELDNCYLTPHLGSCSRRSRYEMELGSVQNLINFFNSNKDSEQTPQNQEKNLFQNKNTSQDTQTLNNQITPSYETKSPDYNQINKWKKY